jgi:hypothetical protein
VRAVIELDDAEGVPQHILHTQCLRVR